MGENKVTDQATGLSDHCGEAGSTKRSLAIFTDEAARDSLIAWQGGILDLAAGFLTDSKQPEFQAKSDVWSHAKSIPFPTRQNITILPNGSMVFDTAVGKEHVHFSIWITAGEVRIGAKVANALVHNERVRKLLSESYDGRPATREVDVGMMIMFDWIFKDAWASFDTMTKAMRDPLMGAVIARRIGEILTHLYVTILSTLLESNPYVVEITPGRQGMKRVKKLVLLEGDRHYFSRYVALRGITISGDFPTDSEKQIHVRVETDDGGSGLRPGTYTDDDGGSFHIQNVTSIR